MLTRTELRLLTEESLNALRLERERKFSQKLTAAIERFEKTIINDFDKKCISAAKSGASIFIEDYSLSNCLGSEFNDLDIFRELSKIAFDYYYTHFSIDIKISEPPSYDEYDDPIIMRLTASW